MLAEFFNNISEDITAQFRIYKENESNGYEPLEKGQYFRIRTFSLFSETNDMFYFLTENNDDSEEKVSWKKAYKKNNIIERIESEEKKLEKTKTDSEKEDSEKSAFSLIGRVFPMIYISERTYKDILNDPSDVPQEYKFLFSRYKDKILNSPGNEDVDASDNYLECLIFHAMRLYLQEQNVVITSEEMYTLHEQCVDCAQGIHQLIENAFFHAGVKEKKGCASFVIRIRKAEDTKYSLNDKKVKFFLELYVTDLLFNNKDFRGLVGKFVDNARTRFMGLKDEDKEKWIEYGINPAEWNEETIKIENMFTGGKPEDLYNKYIKLPDIIAFHYGLQIFNNVVMSNEGYLACCSKNYYENLTGLYKSEVEDNQTKEKMEKWSGTSYAVYIPMRKEKSISYEDTIADNDWSEDIEEAQYNYELYNKNIYSILNEYKNEVSISPELKDMYVKKINQELNSDVNSNNNLIHVIDCSEICRSCYEILAKSLFVILSTNEKVNNIALVNVKNKNEVIKVFRQFALFYDREGKNDLMKNKNIYIVDCEAEMDIAFGGRIDEIINNMQMQLIWGGIGENVKNIIYKLGEHI